MYKNGFIFSLDREESSLPNLSICPLHELWKEEEGLQFRFFPLPFRLSCNEAKQNHGYISHKAADI